MKKLDTKMELILLGLSVTPLILTLYFLNDLPSQVPIHWNIEGKIDGYGSPWLSPLLSLWIYFLFLLLMFIDPKKENLMNFRSLIYKIRLLLTLFFTTITIFILYIGLGYDLPMERIIMTSIPLLFAFLGNLLINVKPNWFIGVRTPWTMSNETVWRKTHRLTGVLWFWSGLILSICGFLLPIKAGLILLLSALGVICLYPILYSYIEYRKQLRVINNTGFSEEKK